MFLQGSLICHNTEILKKIVSCDRKSYVVRAWLCEALWKDILFDWGIPWEPFGSSKSPLRRLGRLLGAPSELIRALLGRLFDSLGMLLIALRRSWGSLGAPGCPQGIPKDPQGVPQASPSGPKGSSRGRQGCYKGTQGSPRVSKGLQKVSNGF